MVQSFQYTTQNEACVYILISESSINFYAQKWIDFVFFLICSFWWYAQSNMLLVFLIAIFLFKIPNRTFQNFKWTHISNSLPWTGICLVFRGGLRDDDSYSVRIQVLTPIVFKAPDNFDLASSWYQIYQTILCSLLNQLPWCIIDFGYVVFLIQHSVTFFWSFCNKYSQKWSGC